jgi:hypothetical protein
MVHYMLYIINYISYDFGTLVLIVIFLFGGTAVGCGVVVAVCLVSCQCAVSILSVN